MGLFSKKKKKDKSKISPKGETKTETPTPAPPPKPPPKGRPRRTKSKTNIIAGIDNITERIFFLEKVEAVVEESTKEKKKREKKEKVSILHFDFGILDFQKSFTCSRIWTCKK